ncbi:uncharacterized protein RAG0_06428 [Rhynchosporium agropyri]|uniref:SAM domain-containing protein n=1 Tax=Rhynchosporium agropyri TaxID=914238 RepID=A0A1E1KGT1_9HELO|nr:uncharacterized protein RAG0_06428 [Rhynchosporium agropyri]
MDLQFVLAHLGITVYWPLLFETGFETWEILKDITERDMEAIGMKLGHRRVRSSIRAKGSRLQQLTYHSPEASERDCNFEGPPDERGVGTVRDMLLQYNRGTAKLRHKCD